jgi:hypothetical protein
MPNMLKQAGDAVLSRDGTVKVNGAVVGVWWTSFWTEGDMQFYNFAFKKGLEPVVSKMFRHEFKAAIPKYLASIDKLPPPGGLV